MILGSLHNLYYHLLASPDSETGLEHVPPYGYSDKSISYCLVLSKTGELVDVQDVRDTSGKKAKPKLHNVPRPPKKSVNISPSFLWGNSQYALGLSKKTFQKNDAKDYFVAFRSYLIKALSKTTDDSLVAVTRFLNWWEAQGFTSDLIKQEHLDSNFIFKIDGSVNFIHQLPEARRLWASLVDDLDSKSPKGQCLITGTTGQSIARLHDGLIGGYFKNNSNKSVWTLVSFNRESFKSYAQDQGSCAPVSEQAAFAYTTALNYLLSRENGHCISINDTSTVFWAEANSATREHKAASWFSSLINPPTDDTQNKLLGLSLEKIAKGRPFQEIAPELDLQTRFYVLGLAPNAARLSIRFWLDSTLGELGQRITEHWQDILISPRPWNEAKPPSINKMLFQLIPRRNKSNRDSPKNLPPAHLSGEFFRAIITGTPYPVSILTKLLSCIRSDGDINGLRVSLIKGVLVRSFSHHSTKELPMALDKDHPSPAYQLGCQFALFERAQFTALGQLNASVKDKYFGTASASPRSVFASLHRNFNRHIADLRRGKKYEKWKGDPQLLAAWLEKRTGEIINQLSNHIPATLNLSEQGLFVLGYYHQRFVPKVSDSVLAVALKDESDDIELVIERD